MKIIGSAVVAIALLAGVAGTLPAQEAGPKKVAPFYTLTMEGMT